MTAHERILATIQRQHTDRVPVDVWLTPEVLDSLKKHTGEHDEYELYKKLGVDKIAWIFPGYGTEIFDPNDSDIAAKTGNPIEPCGTCACDGGGSGLTIRSGPDHQHTSIVDHGCLTGWLKNCGPGRLRIGRASPCNLGTRGHWAFLTIFPLTTLSHHA